MPQVSQNTKQEPAVRQAGYSEGPGWTDDAGPQEQPAGLGVCAAASLTGQR